MKTISVQMSDIEYSIFGLTKSTFSFSELADLIDRQTARQALRQSVEAARQSGLSSMTLDEINAEINAARQCKE